MSSHNWDLPPSDPIPYRRVRQIVDRFHGFCDARKGLPCLDAGGELTTQWEERLSGLAGELLSQAQLRYLAQTSQDRQRHGELPLHIMQARHLAKQAENAAEAVGLEAKLAEMPVAEMPEWFKAAITHSDPLVAQCRREAAHKRRKDAHQSAIKAAKSAAAEVVRLKAEARNTSTRLETRRKERETQAHRVFFHIRQRRATYWAALTRRHLDGQQINAALKADWLAAPPWIHEPPFVDGDHTESNGSEY